MMGLGKRGARKRLVKLNADLEGRLLKAIGIKITPKGFEQATKYLVSLDVLRQEMTPNSEDHSAELAEVRAELTLMGEKLEALRKAVKPLLTKRRPDNLK